ncbi:hypothetical protein [Streptomyces pyxinae]|uniref:hypothetical protein n=1 Tax=Streptomyces pyxinae TaxID=2970734 RepID=UPI002867BB1D|nr:hypothetical protein [Streptomyces sp. LP05-1]
MRPKLKSDVLYVPTGDGVHVFGAGADVALRGRAAYQWLDRLAPHLDGSVELAALVRGLPDDKRELVGALVGRLRDAGCLVDAAEDLPHGLTGRELELYDQEIAFIEYYGPSAARRFEEYRNSRVVVAGAGPAFVALVCSVLRSGVRALRAVRTDEAPTATARLAELVAEALARDPEQRVVHAEFGAAEEAAIGGADLVLHLATAGGTERAERLAEACERSGTPLVQGVVLDDVAWLGPAGATAWRSAWARLAPRGPHRADAFLTGPAAAVVAGHLGLAGFRALTGIGEDSEEGCRVTRVDLETLRTTVHGFLPHPAVLATGQGPETEAEFAARYAALSATPPLTEEEFSACAARCFDPHLGVLRELAERDFTQLPLNVSEAVPHSPGAARIFGSGLGFTEARRRAALRGLAEYAAGAPDPRRYGPADAVYGWELGERRPVAVPAVEVFTAPGPGRAARADTTGPATLVDTTGPATLVDTTGLAARLGWDDAVAAGLAGQCARLALADLADGRARPVALDPAAGAPVGRARELLELLRAAGGTVRAADIGGVLGVPVWAWWEGTRPVAVSCGPGAVAEGLERVLLSRQAALTGDAAYAPPPVPELGPPPGPEQQGDWAPPPETYGMVAALRERGARPVVVPLDHDPAVHEVLPALLRVVLLDG